MRLADERVVHVKRQAPHLGAEFCGPKHYKGFRILQAGLDLRLTVIEVALARWSGLRHYKRP